MIDDTSDDLENDNDSKEFLYEIFICVLYIHGKICE